MTTNCNLNTYTNEQISAWLRGLLTVAYADGHFDPEEQELIASLTQDELIPCTDLGSLETISPQELAKALGNDIEIKENFLRTAVMMAIANGVYSKAEADTVHEFQSALGLDLEALKSLEATLWHPENEKTGEAHHPDLLKPVKKWLDGMDIHDPRVARFVCKMIPSDCPFERDITLFGRKIVHIPPMCKLNPLYDQMVGLRFRSLSFLADDCQEDITPYL
ncbi:Mo-dependent nitrogenase C-terminal domain-containing protein [Geminocystis sp. GBBB08]|uniref:Mo-dependent nitrogenase C-terminal domain-containing protein n=1 Tax=Geminocystis sp. GBBB08 TaxID=2604140 RepID=UPI0027E2BAA9|nr:Mo-dependent nitrogenase C-terminal domain-containing protein [Geminocystis sp. GBBB08]MBL1208914.1 nitrogenase [Geminocystis sp. GBBB08]